MKNRRAQVYCRKIPSTVFWDSKKIPNPSGPNAPEILCLRISFIYLRILQLAAVAPESLKSQEVIYQFATMFAGSDQILRVKWNNFNKVLMFNFEKHRLQEKFTDVTLLAEGKFIKAHRLVLSSTSKYFENIFDKSPESPLIVLDQVAYKDALSLVDYAYRGETEVEAKDLERFMSVGRKLGMKGMAPDDGEDEKNLEPPTPKRGQESASTSENGGNTASDKDGSSSKEQDSGISEEESLPSSPKEDNNSKLPVFVKAEPVTPVGIPKKRKADDGKNKLAIVFVLLDFNFHLSLSRIVFKAQNQKALEASPVASWNCSKSWTSHKHRAQSFLLILPKGVRKVLGEVAWKGLHDQSRPWAIQMHFLWQGVVPHRQTRQAHPKLPPVERSQSFPSPTNSENTSD